VAWDEWLEVVVAQEVDLAGIERKAWTSYFDDGLFDIFLGLVLLIVWVSDLLGESLPSRLWGYGVYALLVGMACLAFWAGKRFITVPRLGRVRFGPARKARRRKTAMILLLQIVAGVLVTGALAASLGRGALTGLGFARSSLLAVTVGVWVMVGLSLLAYFMDFSRGYLIALLYGIGFGGTELLDNPVMFLVAAAVILLIGVIVLIRFVRKYPELDYDVSRGAPFGDE
jgi:MFS family permease